jgi:hypothetical protein
MTSIEWLIEELTPSIALQQKYIDELKDKAKEMHKQEIEDAYWDGGQNIPMSEKSCEQYYQETFVSKGSDTLKDYHIVDTNKMIELPQQETFGKAITLQNNSESKDITELSEESWEGCDGCTEQDEVMYKNGYVKGYNAASSQTDEQGKPLTYWGGLDFTNPNANNIKSDSTQTTSDKWKEYQDWLNEPPEISDKEIEKGAKEWYNKEGAYSASAIALKTWVYAIRWYREQLKTKKD